MFAMKAREREQARRLRREEGMSMKAIASQLDVSVSSVSLWTRDIELTAEQVVALAQSNRLHGNQARGQLAHSRNARARRLDAQREGRDMARGGDPLHQAGCMLYWAEGSKDRNSVQFVNSDAGMIRYFMRFLAECYAVTVERYCFSVNCYVNNGLTLDEIESYWLDTLDLPRSALRKAVVNTAPRASQQLKRNLPYGTGRLMLHSTAVVQSIYGAIQEYAGFDQPAWLDL